MGNLGIGRDLLVATEGKIPTVSPNLSHGHKESLGYAVRVLFGVTIHLARPPLRIEQHRQLRHERRPFGSPGNGTLLTEFLETHLGTIWPGTTVADGGYLGGSTADSGPSTATPHLVATPPSASKWFEFRFWCRDSTA